ncbi:MAG TPA: hypothetical protein VEG38_20910 [Acidimicrobiia bacterium]|nr:hypothetical protein [Acidimicrobiia bacterium]
MTLRQYLYIIRRWRSLVAAGLLIGLVVGWVSAATATNSTTFLATHTMILDAGARGPGAGESFSISHAAVLATQGAVPGRVATRLGVDRRSVETRVSTETRATAGAFLITGRSADRMQAIALADVTAEELLGELGGQAGPLRTLETAASSPIAEKGTGGPSSRVGRALVLGAFGLILGLGCTFAVDRFDNRIRSRRTAEEVLGVPVLAEVPVIPRSARGRLLSFSQPSSACEAYRGLRVAVDRWVAGTDGKDGRGMIAVTSPIASEGKTTTVAHLAAALAEVGRSVLAVCGELRRPRLHLYFDRAPEPGLTNLLSGAPDVRRLTDLNLATIHRGIRFVASGAPVHNVGPLVEEVGDVLKEARDLAHVVLVDTPPLLTRSDAAMLAAQADGVLLVLRAGRTSVGAAARSVELLKRLDIPIIGTVLVGSEASAVRR